MLVRNSVWNGIRDLFDEAEQKALSNAAIEIVKLPPGTMLDDSLINPTLCNKIKDAIAREMGLC